MRVVHPEAPGAGVTLSGAPGDLAAIPRQYASGTLLLIAAIYLLGLVVQAGLKPRLQALTARALRRLPIVGGLYRLADGFVSVLDRKEAADIGAMSPVWCFFGGAGGGAVLALAPGAEPIDIDGSRSACPRGWPAAALPRHTVRGHPIEVGLGLGIYLRLSAPSRVGRSRRRAGHLRLSSTSTDGAK